MIMGLQHLEYCCPRHRRIPTTTIPVKRRRIILLWKTNVWFYCLTLMLLLGAAAAPDWTDCPSPCRCKWASGKKTAICSSGAFTTIPALDSELQVLDLQGNFITILEADAFRSAELLNLQKIYMRNSSLREVDRDAFRELTILVELDLSYNHIASIPRGTFYGNNRLKILTLNGNPLKVLTFEQFPPLPHLRILDLENCLLTEIHNDAFMHLEHLENLNLKYNLFTILSKDPFKPLVSLKSLELFGNPWNCDCKLRIFRNWYLSSNLRTSSITCSEPEGHKGKKWGDISSLGFACSPHVELSRTIIESKIGYNATFACYVKGDPDPEVRWLFERYSIDGDNSTGNNHTYSIEYEKYQNGMWVNLTIINVTELDEGDYACQARSFVEVTIKNATLIIQTFRSLSEANYVFVFIGLLGVGLTILVIVFIVMACSCVKHSSEREIKRRKLKNKTKYSKNIFEQDKHLLDISTSFVDQSSKSSCELINSNTNDDLKHSSSLMLDKYEPIHFIHKIPVKDPTKIIPSPPPVLNTFRVYPPPPEFSNGTSKTKGTLGNIFISVALNHDSNPNDTYPDLLDAHKPSTSMALLNNQTVRFNNNLCKNDRRYCSTSKLSNLNNKLSSPTNSTSREENTGKFPIIQFSGDDANNIITSNTNNENSSACFGNESHCITLRRSNLKQAFSDANCIKTNSDATVAPYATLPRKQLRIVEPIKTEPIYDNMGKRVTIGGSSTISLPDEYDSIPTPPPPPLSKIPKASEFVCL